MPTTKELLSNSIMVETLMKHVLAELLLDVKDGNGFLVPRCMCIIGAQISYMSAAGKKSLSFNEYSKFLFMPKDEDDVFYFLTQEEKKQMLKLHKLGEAQMLASRLWMKHSEDFCSFYAEKTTKDILSEASMLIDSRFKDIPFDKLLPSDVFKIINNSFRHYFWAIDNEQAFFLDVRSAAEKTVDDVYLVDEATKVMEIDAL